MSHLLARNPYVLALLLLALVSQASAQPAPGPAETPAEKPPEAAVEKPAPPELPEIADEPRLVDPATVLPAPLAAKATVDLSESSLREVVEWLRAERKLAVLLDQNALDDAGLLAGEPVSDRLDDAPLYLLLNRLRSRGLAWYYEDEILHITSLEGADQHLTTLPYNLGDLLDAGYDREVLSAVIQDTVAPAHWENVGGPGVLSFLGDVMFVRQSQQVHRQISGLLAALRKHGRQTYVLDPPLHLAVREKLGENVSINLVDTPLDEAVKQLAQLAKIDIRLDALALHEERIRERQPVTLKLAERKLETVLQAMLIDLELTWMVRDGVLWITSRDRASQAGKTAVYDVRDLCRNEEESMALQEALTSQTEASAWDELGGLGTLRFARPGVMIVYQEESMHNEVLKMLQTYRTALRASKPRGLAADDPQAIVTTYYRLHANVAEDLARWLPQLVKPESWKSEQQPEAKGEIHLLASTPDLPRRDEQFGVGGKEATKEVAVVVERSVLIIRQTKEIHQEIQEMMLRVQYGDYLGGKGQRPFVTSVVPVLDGGGFGGGGFGGGDPFGGAQGGGQGGGGFGGGFFTVPSAPARKPAR